MTVGRTFIPLLLVLARACSCGAASSSPSSSLTCSEVVDCVNEDTCNACVNTLTDEPCTGYDFTVGDTCSILGVAYCCSAEASGEQCYVDGNTLEYWECILELQGCTLADMPCLSDATSAFSDDDGGATTADGSAGSTDDSTGTTDDPIDDADTAANDDSGAAALRAPPSAVAQLAGALGLFLAAAAYLQ